MPETTGNSILILGINFKPELTGIGKYTGEMADWLAEQGDRCTVVTTFPYYPSWKIQPPYQGTFYKKESYYSGRQIVYRCPFYIPAKPSGMKRILHDASFFASSSLVLLRLLFKRRHRYIICIAPPFHLGFHALFYRFFKGGKIIYHIQDLQIEAARDLQVVRSAFVFRVLFALERFILKRVNIISSISTGMRNKIASKTGREVHFFPNWVDTVRFYPVNNAGALKPKWGFKPEDKVVLYSGSIGEKQGLDALVDIAVKCLDKPAIRILICGTGPYKEKLQQLASQKGATNMHFLPLQDNDVFNEFLNMADVHLVLQKKEASDLVMPSKLSTILSAGGLVIATAPENTSLYEDITNHRMGIVIPPEDQESLYRAITLACDGDHSEEKANARVYAERFLNKDAILGNMRRELLV